MDLRSARHPDPETGRRRPVADVSVRSNRSGRDRSSGLPRRTLGRLLQSSAGRRARAQETRVAGCDREATGEDRRGHQAPQASPARQTKHRIARRQDSQPLQNGQALSVAHRRGQFSLRTQNANIEREQDLDGIYVIRTSVQKEALSSQEVVVSYKSLSGVERAFRSLKTVDLHVRPIHHRLPDRVRAHILLCVLAYYVEWHMRQLLAPILFDDDDKPQAQAARTSIVAPAQRSATAKLKALTKQTGDRLKVHSFQTLIGDLATIAKNRIQPADKNIAVCDMLTQPTLIQQRALDLLGVTLRPN